LRLFISILNEKEAFYEKPLILADREMVETQSDKILHNAGTEDVSLLVVGDPFGYDGVLNTSLTHSFSIDKFIWPSFV